MKNIFLSLVILGAMICSPGYAAAQKLQLTADEKADLIYMLEEEKLARDVYLAMDEKWDGLVFSNISDAEQVHMDFLIELAEDSGAKIPTTVKKDQPGKFNNAEIQQLFTSLVSSGEKSWKDALLVAAKIEELDIKDLKDRIAKTKNESILETYALLLRGSENHLRAFTRNLNRMGVDYEPLILEENYYGSIVASKGAVGGCGRNQQANCNNDTGRRGRGQGYGNGKGPGQGNCQSSRPRPRRGRG